MKTNMVRRTDAYIRVMVDGLASGITWVHKPNENQGGTLAKDRAAATIHTEEQAFTIRRAVLAQAPNCKVTFDLED